jgi:aspartyl-tRNA(Asn)/glutamyl-tRNA(Gln) amidotransferase subunit C
MSTISLEEVYKLAQLCHLQLSDDVAARMQQELDTILGFVAQLDDADLDDLEPTYQTTGLTNITRDDEVIDYGVTPEELLKNAPATQDGSLKVRRVL